jgi:hypothetical protein
MLTILDSFDTSTETPLRPADDTRLVRRPDGLCAVVRWSNGQVRGLTGAAFASPYGEAAVSYVTRWRSEKQARNQFEHARRAFTRNGEE